MGDSLDALVGLPEGSIPTWTGSNGSIVSGSSISWPSVGGLVDSVSSGIGKVADFGFNLQKQQYQVQSQAQDIQLKSLLGNLGFQTAVTQANSASQIAQINANKAVAQAQGGGSALSPLMMLLIGGGIYLLAKKG
jgi:hypothetical protein